MAAKVVHELIHFGRHFLPIDTARKFWVLEQIGMRGPGVQIEHVNHEDPNRYFTYEIYTKTMEEAYKLGMELLLHTNATLSAGFKGMQAHFVISDSVYLPLIEFQFWSDRENQTFNRLLTPTLFPSKYFTRKLGQMRTTFLSRNGGKKGTQVQRIKLIFGQIAALTADREFIRLLEKKGAFDPKIEKNQSSHNFLVTSDRLYQITFPKGTRVETPLFDASLPFRCAGEKTS